MKEDTETATETGVGNKINDSPRDSVGDFIGSCSGSYGLVSTRPFIGNVEDSPDYFIFSPYIKRGYRIHYRSWGRTVWSMFEWHNETINVWTHFLGFLGILVALVVVCINYTDAVVPSSNSPHLALK